jgi:antitoxin HicB
MKPLTYIATLEPQGASGFLVRFHDVPEAITEGETVELARHQAEDALAAALEGYLECGREFPARTCAPLQARSSLDVPIRPTIAARWLLIREMRSRNLSQVALGRLLERDEKSIRRMLRGKGASLEQILRALAALGIRPALAL